MKERVLRISAVLRVDTDRRCLEHLIEIPDGSPDSETAFLIQHALSTIGSAAWTELPVRRSQTTAERNDLP